MAEVEGFLIQTVKVTIGAALKGFQANFALRKENIYISVYEHVLSQ